MFTCSLTHRPVHTHHKAHLLPNIDTITCLQFPYTDITHEKAHTNGYDLITSIHMITIQVSTFTHKLYLHMQLFYINILSDMIKFRYLLLQMTSSLTIHSLILTDSHIISFTWTCSHILIHKIHSHMLTYILTCSFMNIY